MCCIRLTTIIKLFCPDLRLREHVEVPWTHLAVRWDRNEIMSILTPDHVKAVNRVSVGGAWERGALNWRSLSATGVPEDDLPRVSPSNYIVRMKLAESNWHHRTLEDISQNKIISEWRILFKKLKMHQRRIIYTYLAVELLIAKKS